MNGDIFRAWRRNIGLHGDFTAISVRKDDGGMERERLKEILTGYRKALKRERALVDAVNAKYEQATNTAAPSFDRDHIQAGCRGDRVGACSVELVTMADALEDARRDVGLSVKLLLDTIELLNDEEQKTVLTFRYLRGMSWEDIADDLERARTWTFDQHKQACEYLLTQKEPFV